MKGYHVNIEAQVAENDDFRKVLYSGKSLQLELVSLDVGEVFGEFVLPENDQLFHIISGIGRINVAGNAYEVKDGDVVIVPAGIKHKAINVHDADHLRMYSIVAPPHFQDKLQVRSQKEDEKIKGIEFDGTTTEKYL